jgi:hypothetical protein
MRQDDAVLFQLHAEQTAGEFLKNRASDFYTVFFTQILKFPLVVLPFSQSRGNSATGRFRRGSAKAFFRPALR